MSKLSVTVSAPGKLMLFGEHAVIYGRPCIVTAVNQRMHVCVEKTARNLIVINAPEVGIEKFSVKISELGKAGYPKEAKFVLKAIENFFKKYKVSSGLKIEVKSEFSSQFGFGSSSAVTVCTVKALSVVFDIQVSNKSLFDIAYKTVLDIQGVGSGFDLAAAIWGGTLYYTFGGKTVRPVKIKNLPLIVGYTGIKADTAILVRQVAKLRKGDKKHVDKIFDSIGKISEKAVGLLETSDFRKLGALMNENQKLLVQIGVSSEKLNGLVAAAVGSGAYGAKLSGAGGGDCMIAIADPILTNLIKKAIAKSGGTFLDVKSNAEGVKIE